MQHIPTALPRRASSSISVGISVGIAFGTLTGSARAQQEAPPSVLVEHRYDSGLVANTGTTPAVVISVPIQVPGAQWLRLQFEDIELAGDVFRGTASTLRITSLSDGFEQTLNAVHCAQWRNTSAYFNGDAVLVEVLAEPGTGNNRIVLASATAGATFAPEETICGPVDDRVLSNDPRQARILPVGCTGWMIDDCNHCMLTAGHCSGSGLQVAQFNVPLSNAGGSLQHPPPSDQYAVDAASVQTNGGQGVGNDWGYYGVFANSTTGFTAYQAQGSTSYVLASPPTFNSTHAIRITGYGTDDTPLTSNQVQQTHVGSWAGFSGSSLQYSADTTGGNSGSPILHEPTGTAIGIHTHGGCSSSGGANNGTASTHAGLQGALAAPRGICGAAIVPQNLPFAIATTGTTTVQVHVTGTIDAGSATLHYRYGAGAFTPIAMTQVGVADYEAALPTAQCSDAPEFFFTANSTACGPIASPAGAPATVHTASPGTEVVLLEDHFETNLGWTVTNSPALTSGAWEAGVPVNAGRGDPPADSDGSGRCYVTQNVAGNFDVDAGTTTLTSPVVDMTGGAVVRYDWWFDTSPGSSIGAEDTLVVEVATDAAGTNWQVLRTYGTTASSWRSDAISVGTEVPASATVRVRFTAGDPSPGHVVEAGIDDFRVSRVVCEEPTGTTFCFGDGSLATPCPCVPPNTVPNPSGAFGHGCANSFDLGGGLLAAAGSVAPDTIAFHATIGPSYAGFAFLVKGDATNAAGIANGDGVRCVDGALIRFGGHNAGTNGAAPGTWTYPNAVQTTSVSAATAQSGGQDAFYQLIYRNAAASFCSVGTTNWTNGIQLQWPP